jgi:hypothetical protein
MEAQLEDYDVEYMGMWFPLSFAVNSIENGCKRKKKNSKYKHQFTISMKLDKYLSLVWTSVNQVILVILSELIRRRNSSSSYVGNLWNCSNWCKVYCAFWRVSYSPILHSNDQK